MTLWEESVPKFAEVQRAAKRQCQLPSDARTVRVGIAGPANVELLAPSIEYFFHTIGVRAEVLSFPYESWIELEIEPFGLDYFLFWESAFGLTNGGLLPAAISSADLAQILRRFAAEGPRVIFVPPEPCALEHPIGDVYRAHRIEIESLLTGAGDEPVSVVTIDHLVLQAGLSAWDPGAFWDYALFPVHPDASVVIARFLANVIWNDLASPVRAIAVDLDGTLWGGLVGEEGIGSLNLDERGEGRHFLRLQNWLLQKKNQGFLLGVLSKNEYSIATQPFGGRAEMRLSLEDFDFFEANWGPKPSNLTSVAERLNLDLSQFVFLDDSPHERDEMIRTNPSVRVPNLPTDPAERVGFLDSEGLALKMRVSETDKLRSKSYISALETSSNRDDQGAYLASLDMVLHVDPVDGPAFERAWELVQKTNQFNLAGRRPSRAEFKAEISGSDYAASFTLADRLGAHGIVAVILLKAHSTGLEIVHWVMSCRVFGRGVEWAIAEEMASAQKNMRSRKIWCLAKETDRNAPVRKALSKLGFTSLGKTESSVWETDEVACPDHHLTISRS